MKKYIYILYYRNRNNLLAFVIMSMISAIILCLGEYLCQIYELDSSGCYFTKNSIYFQVDKGENQGPVDFSFLLSDPQEFTANLFVENSTSLLLHECIFMSDYEMSFVGRSFNKSDFEKGEKIAYIGERANEVLDIRDGINIDGETFRVIGKYSSESPVKNLAVYYTRGNLKSISSDETFVVDGSRSSTIKSSFAYICKRLKIQGFSVRVFKNKDNYISSFLTYRKPVLFLVVAFLVFLLASSAAMSFYWLSSHEVLIQISRVAGFYNALGILLGRLLTILWLSMMIIYGLFALCHHRVAPLMFTVSIVVLTFIVVLSYVPISVYKRIRMDRMERNYEGI